MPRSATPATGRRSKQPSAKTPKRTAPKKAKPAAPKTAKRIAAKKAKPTAPKKARQTSVATMQAQISALRTELREAREQQTAAAEVLGVINSSPGNLSPVFDAMLEKTLNICQAALGGMFLYEAGHFRTAALRGAPPAFAEFLRDPLPPQGALAQIVHGEALV